MRALRGRGPAWSMAAGLVLVLQGASSVLGSGRGRPQPVPPLPEAQPAHPVPELDIRFDDEVVDRFLGFVARGGASNEELDAWVRLSGNLELLRKGKLDHDLTPDVLKEAAREASRGGTFVGPQTLGTLGGSDWGLLRETLAAVRAREEDLRGEVAAALAPYLPRGRTLPPLVVHFHLGGCWDGRTSDAVYINLTIFQSRGLRSLPGLDALLVHELFHCVHAAILPSVEDLSSRQAALYWVLLRIQQEGTARHLEYGFLRARSAGNDLDITNLARYEEGLRHVGEYARLLTGIEDSIDAGRFDQVRAQTSTALESGGPLYAIGHSMAMLIEKQGGQGALASTVVNGPLAYARAYLEAVAATGSASLLPPDLPARLTEEEQGYGRAPVAASQARRRGLNLLEQGNRDGAADELKKSIDLDPTDAVSAYNLACVWALEGRRHRALRWLSEAFARGFDNYKHAATDPDLESLRGDREFKILLGLHGFVLPESAPERTTVPGVSP